MAIGELTSVGIVYRGLAIIAGTAAVNVTTYGSASTDIGDSINQALAAVGSSGYVYIPPGSYPLRTSVVYNTNSKIIGAGSDLVTITLGDACWTSLTETRKTDLSASFQLAHNTASSTFGSAVGSAGLYSMFAPTKGGSRKTGVVIRGITVRGNSTGQVDDAAHSFACVYIGNTDGAFVDDVKCYDAGLHIASVSANQRGFGGLCADDINTTISNSTAGGSAATDRCLYDCWGVRGYSVNGTFFNCYGGSTKDTIGRSSFQWAYQTSGWKCINCTASNTSTNTSGNGMMGHGSRGLTFIGCNSYSASGNAFSLFGDNNSGGADSPWDSIIALPSSSADEFTDRLFIDNCYGESAGGVATFFMDTDYIRDVEIGSLILRHTTTSGNCIQTNNATYAQSIRRFKANSITCIQEVDGIACIFDYLRWFNIDKLTILYGNNISTGGVDSGATFNGCRNGRIGTYHLHAATATAPSSGHNVCLFIQSKSGNVCDDIVVGNFSLSCAAATTFAYGIYVDTLQTNIRVLNACATPTGMTITSGRVVHFASTRHATSYLGNSPGCRTFEQGTVQVTSGNSSQTFSFTNTPYVGSSSWNTPAGKNLQITPLTALGTALRYAVTSVTATQFTITLGAAAPTNLDFSYVLDNQLAG